MPVSAAAAPAIGAKIAKGAKMVVNLAMIFTAVYMTKKELEEMVQDTTPLINNQQDLPQKLHRGVADIYPDAKCMFRMVKDMYEGEYRPEDPLAIATAVLSMGFLFTNSESLETRQIDDVKAISYAAGVCARELKRYKEQKGIPAGTEMKSEAEPEAEPGLKAEIEPKAEVEPVISEDPYK